ncbi:MAG: 30S ribosomal protein S18 [Patescibacteria group bacterium]|nr:30S ribosomal protein S18 [Patescibacteria group bacterium]
MNKTKNNPLAKQKNCHFCVNNINDIDYKDGQTLRRFISSYGKIVPRKRSNVCSKHQRKLAAAIKRARVMSLLPFSTR